jgi:hypothetical protein
MEAQTCINPYVPCIPLFSTSVSTPTLKYSKNPRQFTAGGNQSYPEFWNPCYPGYQTLTVAPEPSIEQVALLEK